MSRMGFKIGATKKVSSPEERGVGMGQATNSEVKRCFVELYDELFSHDGYGRIELEMKILRRGQKEVILRCGKEYRFVIDFPEKNG